MANDTNPEVKAAEARRTARNEASLIRKSLSLGWTVIAIDARDGREYRIVAASTKTIDGTTVLLGQEPRQGIWFPVSSWVQK